MSDLRQLGADDTARQPGLPESIKAAGSVSVTFGVASVVSARRVTSREQLSSAFPAQFARRCLRQGSGGEQPYLARSVPNVVVHPGCDVAADAQAHVLPVRVMHFGEHREALPLGVDPQRDHAALAHTVDGRGRTLDIVRIEVVPGHE